MEQFHRTTEPKEAQRRAEAALRYIGENGTYFGLTSIPYFDALRNDVKGFRFRRHLKLDFETVSLDR